MSAAPPVNPSDPRGALSILTQVADSIQGNWATHQAIRQSLATFEALIVEKERLSVPLSPPPVDAA